MFYWMITIFERFGMVLNLKFLTCHSTDRLIVFVEGNSACQAIELLIQKGVPEAHIIFLNLISVSCYFAIWAHPLPIRYMLIFVLILVWINLLISGSWRSPLCLQTVPISEDCHLWDRCCIEWGIPCHTWYGRIWWPLFWDWWLKMRCHMTFIRLKNGTCGTIK